MRFEAVRELDGSLNVSFGVDKDVLDAVRDVLPDFEWGIIDLAGRPTAPVSEKLRALAMVAAFAEAA